MAPTHVAERMLQHAVNCLTCTDSADYSWVMLLIEDSAMHCLPLSCTSKFFIKMGQKALIHAAAAHASMSMLRRYAARRLPKVWLKQPKVCNHHCMDPSAAARGQWQCGQPV